MFGPFLRAKYSPYRKKAEVEPISQEEKDETIARQALEYFNKVEKKVRSKLNEERRRAYMAESENALKKQKYEEEKSYFQEWRIVFLHRVIRGDSIEDADKKAKDAASMVEKSTPNYPNLDPAAFLIDSISEYNEKARASADNLFNEWKKLWEEEEEIPSPKEVAKNIIRRLDLLENK